MRNDVSRGEGGRLARLGPWWAGELGKPSRKNAARVSTTDADARRMKIPGGAIQPAYNVQFATGVHRRAIVGVEVVNTGSDEQ